MCNMSISTAVVTTSTIAAKISAAEIAAHRAEAYSVGIILLAMLPLFFTIFLGWALRRNRAISRRKKADRVLEVARDLSLSEVCRIAARMGITETFIPRTLATAFSRDLLAEFLASLVKANFVDGPTVALFATINYPAKEDDPFVIAFGKRHPELKQQLCEEIYALRQETAKQQKLRRQNAVIEKGLKAAGVTLKVGQQNV
jgi:hypothetical protein